MKRSAASLLTLALIAAAGFACGGSTKQAPVPAPVADAPATDSELARVLEIDPRIRVGTLPNGLTYYVLEHRKPEQRAQLWLGVNAGSIQEDDDQQGLAHFVEHMAFNGTEGFEKLAIVNYLESIGMKFGPDVNAYTSFDETVYQLQVPTDDPAFVDKGFQILREWSGRIAFEPGEVDKERGVVTEEWRLGRGAWKRILDKQYPVLFNGSRYAERLPIGKAEILQAAPPDALVRFYKDWYRPDLMAVVAVGDFDGAAVEAQIKRVFGDLAMPAQPRQRAAAPVPAHDGTLVTIETDPEMPQTQLAVYNKLPKRPERTVGDYRRFIVEQLYHSMLGARLTEIGREPDAPFVYAYSYTSDLTRTADGFVRSAGVKEGRLQDALTVLADEVERVERHGFTATELERARLQLARDYQRLVIERDKRDGDVFAAEILRNYFEGEMMPGIEAELAIVDKYLPTITLDELNHLANQWGGPANRVVTVSGPDSLNKPDPAALLAILDGSSAKQLTPYDDAVSSEPLMARRPAAGSVTSRVEVAELGVTEFTLSNGVRVIVKPTDFQNDEVQIEAFSPGGHSLASDADYLSASMASDVVAEGGVGNFDANQLRKLLAGKTVSISPWIGELEEGLWGSASPRDLETAMQLIHLYMTAPRRDPAAFSAWQARQTEWVRNRRLSPESAFFEDMSAKITMNHPRRQPLTPEKVAAVDLDRALDFYKNRFADASDFTFVIVGNVDPKTLEPLLTTYLASLPAAGRKESWRDVGVTYPKGVETFTARRGSEPKSFVYLAFHGADSWSEAGANDAQMLGEALQIRLREVMREEMGGVYFVAPSASISRRPKQRRSLSFFFPCNPDNVDTLTSAIFDELGALQKRGIGADYVGKIKQIRTRQHELDMKRNGYWARKLAEAYRYGDDPRGILEFDQWTQKVSSERIQSAAKRFGVKGQYFLGVLRPAE